MALPTNLATGDLINEAWVDSVTNSIAALDNATSAAFLAAIKAALDSRYAPISGASTAYAPNATASSVNPNIGTTGTKVGSWIRMGKTIHWRALITANGTGIAAGTGSYSLDLPPITPKSSGIIGVGWIYGAAAFVPFVVDWAGGVTRLLRTQDGGAVTQAHGFTAGGHVMNVSGTIEEA